MAETIDAHHHLWSYREPEFAWISEEMALLKRDFTMFDLRCARSAAGVDGSVVVQARQSTAETDWLLSVARVDTSIRGVVGWLPMCSQYFAQVLASYSRHVQLKGLRHVLQDEPDPNFVLSGPFNRGMEAVTSSGLTYDLLIREGQMPQTLQCVARHPNQVFVLDHLAKPRIGEAPSREWVRNIGLLAAMPNVSCKLSGLVTEAEWSSWTLDQLRPYLDIALSAFGAQRLMAGSDWPVCLLASTYEQWWTTLRAWADDLSTSQRDDIFGATAKRVYRLE